MARVGRNEPCPCGSGKKYKKCCLEAAGGKPAAAQPSRPVQDRDEQIVAAIQRWAMDYFGEAYAPDVEFPYEIEWLDLMLVGPWSVYEYFVDGERVAERFLAERGSTLPDRERAWIEAQLRAWLSVWEILEVEPGKGVRARDLLTGEDRFVHEVLGSKMLIVRDGVLVRVVDFDGASYFCGTHPYRLPPRIVALFVEAARQVLACGRAVPTDKPIPVAWFHEEGAAVDLISMWQDAAEAAQNQPPPKLQNTDGDDLLMTTDRYELASRVRDEVERRLRALPWAHEAESGGRELVLKFLRPGNPMIKSWDNTVVGTARLTRRALRLETNSVKRADLLRGRVEEACGDLIRWKEREHADPEAIMREVEWAPDQRRLPASKQPPPEVLAALHRMKAQRYADWLDTKLATLDGRTPHQAMNTANLRSKLDVLLKEIEHEEMRQPAPQRFDIGSLRRELGL